MSQLQRLSMLEAISKYVMYPLWDARDRSIKLREWRELEQTQWLPFHEIQERQLRKLQFMVSYAWEYSPFYRNLMQKAGLVPADVRSISDLGQLPVTTKQDVRLAGSSMVSSQFSKEGLISTKTGGSTGTALKLYFDKRCEELRNAAAIRADRWGGWDLGMPRGALWGNPPKTVSLKGRLRNALLDRTFVLDTMEMSQSSMDAFIEKANHHRRVALFGHAHSIYVLARHILEHSRQMVVPRAVISTSMMLLENERAVIERAMGCKVTNRYGCEEVGLIASECEQHEGLHINLEHLIVEVLGDDGEPVGPGQDGKIVLTDLCNLGMPLLRYRIEDVGVLSEKVCSCGRALPMFERIAGRVADFLKKRDGTLVAGVSLVERTLTAISGIEQMQLVQDRINQIEINRVRGAGHTPQTDEMLVREMRVVFGDDVAIVINDVTAIPQSSNGKHRFSVCNI